MTIEDTKVKDDVVESWLNAEKATVSDESTKEPAIRDSNLPAGVGMRYHSLEEAGWAYVYHQETGDRSVINRNMLQQQLLRTLPNGSKAFDVKPPRDKAGKVVVPFVGKHKCLLHKDDPDRAYYDSLGFVVCLRDGLPSIHSQKLHMMKKHKVEWTTIEDTRKEHERKEDKDFQRALYTRLAGEKEEKAPLYVSKKDKENK